MKPFMLALGGSKSGEDDEESPASGKADESAERTYAREAYSAVKDRDEEGFVEAFLGAIRACKKKPEPEVSDDDEG